MILRDFNATASESHDLIVIGGGVYGICLTLEAARLGMRPLLLERDDFGSQTSWNSLRIVHGGLRYLQSLDLRRFSQSVGERQWFFKHFPDLVEPLECLMPLYGRGMRTPSMLRLALAANEVLSRSSNKGPSGDRLLPTGRVISGRQTVQKFSLVDQDELKGGAVWFDALMPMPYRLLIEILHWATSCGATALNYAEAVALPDSQSRPLSVQVVDRTNGEQSVFKAPVVVNTGGPWCREITERLGQPSDRLHQVSLGFNVLLDIPQLSRSALAVEPRKPGARTYFLVPMDGRVLAGTFHAPWLDSLQEGRVCSEWLDEFVNDLSVAIPGLEITRRHILRVDWGFLPTDHRGSARQSRKPMIIHHHDEGGIPGLFTVSGVKFTTARLVAEQAVQRIRSYLGSEDRKHRCRPRPTPTSWMPLRELRQKLPNHEKEVAAEAHHIMNRESVAHLDDLMLRRTDWAADPTTAVEIAQRIAPLLRWDEAKVSRETQRFEGLIEDHRL